jgi:hypothetical protein
MVGAIAKDGCTDGFSMRLIYTDTQRFLSWKEKDCPTSE